MSLGHPLAILLPAPAPSPWGEGVPPLQVVAGFQVRLVAGRRASATLVFFAPVGFGFGSAIGSSKQQATGRLVGRWIGGSLPCPVGLGGLEGLVHASRLNPMGLPA